MRRLVIVKRIAEIPNVVVLAHPGLGTSIFQLPCNQFRDFVCALVDWPVLSKSVGVVKFVDVEARQMAELDSYADHPAHYGACGMAAQPSVRY